MDGKDSQVTCEEFREWWLNAKFGETPIALLFGLDGHLDGCADCLVWTRVGYLKEIDDKKIDK